MSQLWLHITPHISRRKLQICCAAMYLVLHNLSVLLTVLFLFFLNFSNIFLSFPDNYHLSDGMKPVVEDKLLCYKVYIKTHIYIYLLLLYNISITHIEHSPNCTAQNPVRQWQPTLIYIYIYILWRGNWLKSLNRTLFSHVWRRGRLALDPLQK